MTALLVWLVVIAATMTILLSRLRINWYTLLLLHLSITYIAPVAMIFMGVDFPLHSHVTTHPEAAQTAVGGTLLLVFLMASWMGYLVVGRSRRRGIPGPVNSRLLTGLTVMIGAATIAWIVSFGGVIAAFSSIMDIRAGRVVSESRVPWFGGLTKAAWLSFMIGFAAYVERKKVGRPRKPSGWLLMAISAVALLLRGSRGAIARVLVGISLYLAKTRSRLSTGMEERKRRRRRLWPLFVATATIGIAVVVLFKPSVTLMGSITSGRSLTEGIGEFRRYFEQRNYSQAGTLSLLGRLASETSHYPILTTLAYEFDRRNPQERDYGRDVFVAVAKLLPASIYEPEDVGLSYRSTELVIGRWESQIPPGIVAWLILTGGPGAFFVLGSFLLGVVLAASERLTSRILRRAWWRNVGYISLGLVVGPGIVSGSMGDLFRDVASVFVVLWSAEVVGRSLFFIRTQVFRVKPARGKVAVCAE